MGHSLLKDMPGLLQPYSFAHVISTHQIPTDQKELSFQAYQDPSPVISHPAEFTIYSNSNSGTPSQGLH
jgi:hypothetical protein